MGNIEELKQKSNEVLKNLKEQAEKDLGSAMKIEYANDLKDIEIVNEVKSSLQSMLEQLDKGKAETFSKIDKDLEKFGKLKEIFNMVEIMEDPTNEFKELAKEQIKQVENNIKELNEFKANYEYKSNIIREMLDKYFEFKVGEDGKCYISQETIDFSKLMKA